MKKKLLCMLLTAILILTPACTALADSTDSTSSSAEAVSETDTEVDADGEAEAGTVTEESDELAAASTADEAAVDLYENADDPDDGIVEDTDSSEDPSAAIEAEGSEVDDDSTTVGDVAEDTDGNVSEGSEDMDDSEETSAKNTEEVISEDTDTAISEDLTSTDATVAVSTGTSDIPSDAVSYNGHYYYLYPSGTASTWDEAEEYCESLGGYLACITSSGEDAFLYDYITSKQYKSVYFGLSDEENEGTWKWVSGEAVSYTNWAENEPNSESSSEDYGMYYSNYPDGTWNDGTFTGTAGNAFLCEWGTVSVTAPGQAVISSVKSTTYNSIQIKWKEVSGADGYYIYYKKADGTRTCWKNIKGGSKVSCTHTGLKTGTKYTYYVRAYKKSGISKVLGAYSTAKSATPALDKATIKSAASKSYSSIKITWKRVSGASGYRIYYKTSSGKKKYIAQVSSGSTVHYTHTGLDTGTKYTYYVRAYRTVDGKKVYGSYSSAKSATPKLAKTTLKSVKASGTTATVKWSKVSGASGYRIYYKTSGGSWKYVKQVSSSTTSYKKSGLTAGKKYYFRVRAYRTVNGKKVYGSYSSSKSVTISSNKYVKTGEYEYVNTSSYRDGAPASSTYVNVKKISSGKIQVLVEWIGNYGNSIADTDVITVSVSNNKTSTFSYTVYYPSGTYYGKMQITFHNGYLILKFKLNSSDTWDTQKLTYRGSTTYF